MTRTEAKKRIAQLAEEIRGHDHRYYVLDAPSISDTAYDELFRELQDLESSFPELRSLDSPTQRVGGNPRSGFKEVRHLERMGSIESSNTLEDLLRFDAKVRESLGTSVVTYLAEPKFDGLSLELVYEEGIFVRGSTRGDGEVGEDVTENLRTIRSLPLHLSDSGPSVRGTIAIRGEALLPLREFEALARRAGETESASRQLKTPRNIAAGAVRQLDPRVTAERHLDLYAYDIRGRAIVELSSQSEVLATLLNWGFRVDRGSRVCTGIADAVRYHSEMLASRDSLAYEIDGVVFKVNERRGQDALGATSRHPHWAFAYKFPAPTKETTVREVAVQVGRTGKLTPVARLNPVELMRVTVENATLHNEDEALRKDVRVGDTVRVRRAGDVIPEVVEVLLAKRPGDARVFRMPTTCPSCGATVEREGADHVCPNGLACPAQLEAHLAHFAAPEAMDITGLATAAIRQLIERGLVKNLADLYTLTPIDFVGLEGFAEKSIENMMAALEASKRPRLDRFLFALGIEHVGETVARQLAEHFGALTPLMAATADELHQIRISGIGPEVAESVAHFFASKRNRKVLDRLLEAGVKPVHEVRAKGPQPLAGQVVVFTGTLESLTRPEAQRRAEDAGARVASAISKRVTLVVAGPGAGLKIRNAREIGNIKIVDEAEFLKRVGGK